MCTTGILRLAESSYLLFKNKDFGRERFEDRLVVSREVFGVEGISTWAQRDPSTDEFSGFSIGANKHGLLCADSNVREEPPDGSNYDLLTKIALTEGHSVESAVDAVEHAVRKQPYWCANLVMVDKTVAVGVEVRGREISTEYDPDRLTRTNHHLKFGKNESDQDKTTSQPRLLSSANRLSKASSVDDILELQSSHDNGPTGICSHSSYPTVYSYLLHWQPEGTRLLVSQGQPCGTPGHYDLKIPLGDQWSPQEEIQFREAYPSKSALADSH